MSILTLFFVLIIISSGSAPMSCTYKWHEHASSLYPKIVLQRRYLIVIYDWRNRLVPGKAHTLSTKVRGVFVSIDRFLRLLTPRPFCGLGNLYVRECLPCSYEYTHKRVRDKRKTIPSGDLCRLSNYVKCFLYATPRTPQHPAIVYLKNSPLHISQSVRQ